MQYHYPVVVYGIKVKGDKMRLYNGCPDSELKALWKNQDNLLKRVKAFRPDAHCTYHHPTGRTVSGWVVHEWGKEISGYHETMVLALLDAIDKLTPEKQN